MKLLYAIFTTLILLQAVTPAHAEAVKPEDLIAKTIKESGGINSVNDELRVDVVKGKSQLEQVANANLTITKIDFDMAAGSFTAFISINDNLPIEANGTFTEVTKLPVLSRKFAKDEIISKDDVTYLEVEASKVRGSFITDGNMIVGKSPTRALFKGRPVQLSELTEPKVVVKNKIMTLSYNNAALKIEAHGVALQDGAVGQTIKFKNESSGKIIIAKIMDGDTAQVQAAENVLASN